MTSVIGVIRHFCATEYTAGNRTIPSRPRLAAKRATLRHRQPFEIRGLRRNNRSHGPQRSASCQTWRRWAAMIAQAPNSTFLRTALKAVPTAPIWLLFGKRSTSVTSSKTSRRPEQAGSSLNSRKWSMTCAKVKRPATHRVNDVSRRVDLIGHRHDLIPNSTPRYHATRPWPERASRPAGSLQCFLARALRWALGEFCFFFRTEFRTFFSGAFAATIS